ncbi:MAG: esterase [Acidimicrobiales bacterium mtb01]|nr:MAG: esterase [Acidimicrobiales bacterium mtb01]
MSLLLGWTVSEAPLLCAVGQTILHIRGLRRLGPLGRAALWLLTPALWIFYAFMYREGRKAGGIAAGALSNEIPDHEGPVLSGVAPRRVAPYRPLPLLHRDYTTSDTRDIAYGPDPKFNRLDIWRRPDIPTSQHTPVLVQIHGGGWMIGDNKTQALPLLAAAAEAGWTCVVPRYRLSPRAPWPDHIIDVNSVIAWTKANIATFGGDASFVAITGGSAGGHLTSLAALASSHPDFKPGFEDADTSVQAAVPFYGAYDWTDRDGTQGPTLAEFIARWVVKRSKTEAPDVYERASPRSWIRPDAPPFFVLHGVIDSLLTVEQARAFVNELRATSTSPVVYAELPWAEHAFDLTQSVRTRGVIPPILSFLKTAYEATRD